VGFGASADISLSSESSGAATRRASTSFSNRASSSSFCRRTSYTFFIVFKPARRVKSSGYPHFRERVPVCQEGTRGQKCTPLTEQEKYGHQHHHDDRDHHENLIARKPRLGRVASGTHGEQRRRRVVFVGNDLCGGKRRRGLFLFLAIETQGSTFRNRKSAGRTFSDLRCNRKF